MQPVNTKYKKEEKKISNLRFPGFEGEWIVQKIGDISEIIGGGTPDSTIDKYWDGEVQWFIPTELKTKYVSVSKRTITELGLRKSSAKLLPIGAILLTTRATIGDTSIALRECTTNQGLQSIVVNYQNCNEWVYYLINNIKKELTKRASGSTFLEISKKELKKIRVSLPSLPEQKKIASFLSAVDQKIQHLTRKKELLELYKKGVMQKIFSQKIRFKPDGAGFGSAQPAGVGPEAKQNRVVERSRNYPDWEEKRLGEICEMTSSKRVYLSDYVDRGIPFYRGKEISELKKNQIPSDLLYITDERYKEFKLKYGAPVKGDILITAVGTLGNIFRIRNNDKFYFKDGNLIWLRNISENSEFLEFYIQYNINELIKTSIGSTQKALTIVELKKIKLFIPSLEEQQKITSFLSNIDSKIESIKTQITQTQKFKKGLLQQMFV